MYVLDCGSNGMLISMSMTTGPGKTRPSVRYRIIQSTTEPVAPHYSSRAMSPAPMYFKRVPQTYICCFKVRYTLYCTNTPNLSFAGCNVCANPPHLRKKWIYLNVPLYRAVQPIDSRDESEAAASGNAGSDAVVVGDVH